ARSHGWPRAAGARSSRAGSGLWPRGRGVGTWLGEAAGGVRIQYDRLAAPPRPFALGLALHARVFPQLASGVGRVEADGLPPQRFVARAVEVAVVRAAERDRELIADLAAKGALLGEAQMMRVGRFAAAHEAGLTGHALEVRLVAGAARIAARRRALMGR